MTAACFEHHPIIGHSVQRMADFEEQVIKTIEGHSRTVFAWCVLPNHYHLLTETADIQALQKALAQLHGRTSFQWNGEEQRRGRQVCFESVEREIKSSRHFWATLNYFHHNPVKHGYVQRWQEWPYSSARDYLEAMSREEAESIWNEYRLLDYGKGWDDF